MSKANSHLVSIVVPVYNASRFIDETINTVLDQTYTNWELLLIDDKSTDESVKLIKPYAAKDKRIKLLRNKKNSGAAVSRNKGIDAAKGRYIAFLDADDLWSPTKLEKQAAFMQKQDCAFSFTGYEFADENGKANGKKVHVPETITYKQALKNTTIWTSTVMLDMQAISKPTSHMPDIGSEDTATWWKILKTISMAYGLDQILSYYRRTKSSLSANKFYSLQRTWHLYIKMEKINFVTAIYHMAIYSVNATKRRM